MTRVSRAADYPFFDNGGDPLAFAHRGGALFGDERRLENSLQAFQTAVDLGYRYVETDVHATRDGVLLAMHDATLERTTDAEGVIGEMLYADLAHAKIGGVEAIPRLDEVMTTWPELKLNIDAKSPAAVSLLARSVQEHRAWDRVCVASFSVAGLRRLRSELGPRVASPYSVVGIGAMIALPGTGVRRLALGRSAQVFQVPIRRGPLEIVTPAFLDRAHELGKQVHVWTVNEAPEINRLLDLGVDGIFTDHIDVLRDVYLSRGIWKGRDDHVRPDPGNRR